MPKRYIFNQKIVATCDNCPAQYENYKPRTYIVIGYGCSAVTPFRDFVGDDHKKGVFPVWCPLEEA